MDSPIAWTILAVLAIASFIYAIYCQHKNKEKKEFSYIQKSNSLIRKKKSKFDKLNITYNNQAVEDLCVSRFTIWNSGNKTLNSFDIVKTKELTIHAVDDNKILDVELIKCSEETNQFEIKIIDDKTVKILFDYVDKSDGIVIQLIHTGEPSCMSIDCKIKGGKSIKNKVNNTAPKFVKKVLSLNKFENCFIIAVCIVSVIVLILGILSTIAIFNSDLQNSLFSSSQTSTVISQSPKRTAIFTSVLSWFEGITLFAIYYPLAKRIFNLGVPKKLKKHSEFIE